MTKIKRLDRSAAQDNIVILCLCLMFIMQMVMFSSTGWSPIHDKIYLLGMLSEVALIFFALFGKKKSSIEIKLLVIFAFWLISTRILNRDVTVSEDYLYIRIYILSVSIMYCGFVLDEKKRKTAAIAVSVIICAYYTILSCAGIYASVIGEDIKLPLSITATTYKEASTRILTVDGNNRNTVSMWFALACCLLLYQISVCKKNVVRILLAVVGLALYAAISLTMSRTTMGALAVALTMFAMMLVDKKAAGKNIKVRAAALFCTILFVLPLSYIGHDYVCGAVTRLAVSFQSETEDINDMTEEHEKEEKTEEKVVQFDDYRNASSIKTFEGRTYIWKSGIQAILAEPDRLIKGRLDKDYMYVPDLFHDRSDPAFRGHTINMHNYLADILMRTGLPGFILVLAFTVLLVIRMIKVFFAKDIEISVKVLMLPIAASFVKGMMEAVLLSTEDIMNTLFCFIAGVFLAYSYELLPGKKAENETSLPSEY